MIALARRRIDVLCGPCSATNGSTPPPTGDGQSCLTTPLRFPVAWNSPVVGLGGAFADHLWVDDAAATAGVAAAVRLAPGPSGLQCPGKFTSQFAASLHLEGL